MCITNQRETTVVWDRQTGKPVSRAIVWQCRRTSDLCDRMKKDGLESMVRKKTGLVIDAYFSATKLAWILEHIPHARARAEAGELLFGTIETWLLWNLSGGKAHITDYTNASRTVLFNIHELQWDNDLLDYFSIPRSMLPEVRNCSQIFALAEKQWLGAEIPVGGMAGDQQAALFGQTCFNPGSVKNTYGTGCFLLMHTGTKAVTSENGLLTTIAWGLTDEISYALEGSVFVAGAAVQWLRDELKIIASAADSEDLAGSIPDNQGVYLVPAFVGLGTPYWDMYARGTMVGLTRGAGRAHLARAALEAIAYQTHDVLKVMAQESGLNIEILRADGGAAANNLLMQFQSDILGITVERPSITDSTAIGAGYLAGLAAGFWQNLHELENIRRVDRVFKPDMPAEYRERALNGWKQAVTRTLSSCPRE
jgi:glycerol kinase